MASEGIYESSLCPDFARLPVGPKRVETEENKLARLLHPRKPLLEKV